MPFLDWVNKNQAVKTSQKVPYRMLRAVSLTPATLGHGFAQMTQLYLPLDGHLGIYPASNVYRGGYRFTKHFYGLPSDSRPARAHARRRFERRVLCARTIDTGPEVKHWVRNIERQEKTSFWLPTSTDYFYPDFVTELHDGRVLVIEYKGEDRWDNEDSKEKRLVGRRWEEAGGKQCLFLMLRKKDEVKGGIENQVVNKTSKL